MVLGCSNLMYYITRDPGMSHLYSFMIFTGLIHVFHLCIHRQKVTKWNVILFLFLISMVVALRPLNLVFISFPIVYILFQFREKIPMLKFQKPLFGLLVGLGVALIPVVLQLAYVFWFGANNGVFVYIPILLLVVLWIIGQLRKQNYFSLLFVGYFLAISITYAAWWSPTLGCGFGHRGFTEHLAFFALPMAGLIRSLKLQAIKIAWVITLLIFILLFVAQYNFDDCWRGDGAWDWMEFSGLFRF